MRFLHEAIDMNRVTYNRYSYKVTLVFTPLLSSLPSCLYSCHQGSILYNYIVRHLRLDTESLALKQSIRHFSLSLSLPILYQNYSGWGNDYGHHCGRMVGGRGGGGGCRGFGQVLKCTAPGSGSDQPALVIFYQTAQICHGSVRSFLVASYVIVIHKSDIHCDAVIIKLT